MNERITADQFYELQDALTWDEKNFPQMLEKHTGIIAKPYIGYSYYDAAGNYIGDSEYKSLAEILEDAEMEENK